MPDPFAGLKDALDDIDSARQHGNERLRVLGVILAGVTKNTRLGSVLTEYVEKAFTRPGDYCLNSRRKLGDQWLCQKRRRWAKPLSRLKHKITEQYRELAREIEKRFKVLDEQ